MLTYRGMMGVCRCKGVELWWTVFKMGRPVRGVPRASILAPIAIPAVSIDLGEL